MSFPLPRCGIAGPRLSGKSTMPLRTLGKDYEYVTFDDFVDPGLVSFLTGLRTEMMFEDGPLAGSLFENFVVSEILKRETHKGERPELSFVRTSNGVEVDLVIDRGSSRQFIEVKNPETFRPDLLKGIRSLKGKADEGIPKEF